MSKLGYARMPYIGSRVVDGFGVALIDEWIKSLPGKPASTPLTPGTTEATALKRLLDRRPTDAEGHKQAIQALLKSTPGALALAVEMHRGTLSGDDFRMAVSQGAGASSSDVRGLVETFVPEGQRRATLGPNIDPQVVLRLRGDHERGKLIYFSDAARCRACHELNDRGKSLGPTLAEINKKYPTRSDLIIHVLRPSQKIDDPFAAYQVATTDGRQLSGLLVEKNDRQIVLKTVEKQTLAIDRDDIDEMVRSEKSLMPDGVLSDLTAQEAADLLEYIRSSKE
jgi:putative heme-binding domain-containing protein